MIQAYIIGVGIHLVPLKSSKSIVPILQREYLAPFQPYGDLTFSHADYI